MVSVERILAPSRPPAREPKGFSQEVSDCGGDGISSSRLRSPSGNESPQLLFRPWLEGDADCLFQISDAPVMWSTPHAHAPYVSLGH